MSVSDTAKDVIRIASTAGLSKDVIDLMEKKLSLLTEELQSAQARIKELESENADLHSKIPNASPTAPTFTAEEKSIIRCLACWQDGGDQELAQVLRQTIGAIKKYLNKLKQIGFSDSSSYMPQMGTIWYLTDRGNAFAVDNGLDSGAPPRLYPRGLSRE
ncbi:MAG: hypothetical protein ABSC38_07270 [Verrucomicrobiia bacterium]